MGGYIVSNTQRTCQRQSKWELPIESFCNWLSISAVSNLYNRSRSMLKVGIAIDCRFIRLVSSSDWLRIDNKLAYVSVILTVDHWSRGLLVDSSFTCRAISNMISSSPFMFSISMSLRALRSDLASKKFNSRVCLVLDEMGLKCGNCLDVMELKEVWKTVSRRNRPSWANRLHIVRLEATIHLSWMLKIRTKS